MDACFFQALLTFSPVNVAVPRSFAPYFFRSYAGIFRYYGERMLRPSRTFFGVTLETWLISDLSWKSQGFSLSPARLEHEHIAGLKNRKNVYAKSVHFETGARKNVSDRPHLLIPHTFFLRFLQTLAAPINGLLSHMTTVKVCEQNFIGAEMWV